jgi:hypothetical protein
MFEDQDFVDELMGELDLEEDDDEENQTFLLDLIFSVLQQFLHLY